MTEAEQMSAWNNLVMHADPNAFEEGDNRRAAAIACIYMGAVNNGGLNSFLTSSYDLDAREVLTALEKLGANTAAKQLRHVLEQLGEALPAMTQNERWERLEALWIDELDAFDVLTEDADRDLIAALEKHVGEYPVFYLSAIADGDPE